MTRIRTGVYGLDPLVDGGLRKNTLTVAIGSSGAGKTTLATQFLRRGLEEGTEGIYITLDEPPGQLIEEAKLMGWTEIEDYIDDETLVYIDASGREFSKFVKEEFADFVDEWEGMSARLVIDPLTPVIWAVNDPAEQRDLISFLFRQTKKIATVICTLEEHGTLGNLSGPETIIPMYLADNVIHLRYVATNDLYNRELKVIKMRSSRHSNYYHPYEIVPGAGLVIKEVSMEDTDTKVLDLKDAFKDIYKSLSNEDKTKLSKAEWKRVLKLMDRAHGHRASLIDSMEFIRIVLSDYGVRLPEPDKEGSEGE